MDEGTLNAAGAVELLRWWERVDSVLALGGGEEASMPAEVAALGEARAQARLAREWKKSDELRDQIAALGWDVRDTKDGQKITKRGGA